LRDEGLFFDDKKFLVKGLREEAFFQNFYD
jgi:hypothetical protein